MNNFEAKYLKISKKYLAEKMKKLHIHSTSETQEIELKSDSFLHKILDKILK